MSTLPSITGKTRLYAIVGDPVVQVRSPEVYCGELAKAGIDAVLVPVHIAASEIHEVLPALLKLRNLDGVLVTAPFKADALAIADRVHPRAQRVGAVNALRREADGGWFGDMFDGEGFVRGLIAHGHELAGKRALVIGCGGAGSAIAGALLDAGVKALSVYDKDTARAANLANLLARDADGCDVRSAAASAAGHDLIVNASIVGMRDDDGMPVDLGPLDSQVIVGDVVLRPADRPSALIAHARRYGCPTATGVDMHTGQIDAILEFFHIR
ncbi:shikimate dehydrogenase [Paraburkholderia sp. Cy-641]|uniref:shikimate dehydrogenase family protein n=1 Tax=Paraburkholderia sp. Cy-641 TaxID=2608337 RepID=UPI00141FA0EA|nr:ThiF family adenylyltransferase [Paraburkholderia sp. Cy-641]NIF75827.1 shikimate dehydrogenase [Paraburkholderia sp. Cy-641]